jgi:hypothetical protein
MKYYINYADDAFKYKQNFSLKMAKAKGGFDDVIGYIRGDIDKEFYKKNKKILDQPRGGGYWLWKSYFINKKLVELNDGDYLFYSDSGAFFLKNIDILIETLKKSNQDIMAFELPLIEKQWTKKELFINMNCDNDIYKNSNQIMAGFHLIRKTDFTINFYQEYLELSSVEINITDKRNNKVQQCDAFVDHRHDQSIFSLLYKKYNLKPFKDPTQYGKYPRGYGGSKEKYPKDNSLVLLKNGRLFMSKKYEEKYENIIFLHRLENPIIGLVKYKLKELLYKLKLYNGLVA